MVDEVCVYAVYVAYMYKYNFAGFLSDKCKLLEVCGGGILFSIQYLVYGVAATERCVI